MRPIKFIGLCILILLPSGYAVADNFPKLAVPKVVECYALADTVDINFIQCIIKKVEKLPNPKNYHMRVYSSDLKKGDNGKLSIIFYNDQGSMIYCIANEGTLLSIDSCASDKGRPIKPEQEWRLLP